MRSRSHKHPTYVVAAVLCLCSAAVAGPIPPGPPIHPAFQGDGLLVLDNSDEGSGQRNEGILLVDTHTQEIERILDRNTILQAQVDAGVIGSIAAGEINFREAGIAYNGEAFFFVERDSDSVMKFTKFGELSVHVRASDFGTGTNLKGLAVDNKSGQVFVVNDSTDSIWEFDPDVPNTITEAVTEADIVAANGGDSIDLNGGLTADPDGNLYVTSDRRTTSNPTNTLFKVDSAGSVTVIAKTGALDDIDNFLAYDTETNTVVVADDGDSGGSSTATALLDVDQSGNITTLADKTTLDNLVSTTADLEGGLAFGRIRTGFIKFDPITERRLFLAESGSNSILVIDKSVSPTDLQIYLSQADILSQVDYLPGTFPELEGGISFIPEPSSLFLLGISGLGAWGLNRRRNRQEAACRKKCLTSSTQTTA